MRLLATKGAWLDAADGDDDTPLHLAARGLPPSVDALALAGDGSEQGGGAAAAGPQYAAAVAALVSADSVAVVWFFLSFPHVCNM